MVSPRKIDCNEHGIIIFTGFWNGSKAKMQSMRFIDKSNKGMLWFVPEKQCF